MSAIYGPVGPSAGVLRIDLHVHSRMGSADSSTSPEEIAETAARRGLRGVVLAEHYRIWPRAEAARYSTPSVTIFPAAEVTTEVGHAVVIGLEHYPRERRIDRLAEEARDAGGVLVLAHPFRALFDSTGRTARRDLDLRIYRLAEAGLIHAVEVDNNGCPELENDAARRFAAQSGLVPVCGSDAHTPAGIGRSWTSFPASLHASDAAGLAAAIRLLHGRRPVPAELPDVGGLYPLAAAPGRTHQLYQFSRQPSGLEGWQPGTSIEPSVL